MMTRLFKLFISALIAIFAVGSLAACSASEPVDMSTITSVIDVRTPEETTAGHLDGALLFDIQGPDFAAQLITLDKAGNYFVYCRSGNRAGQAISTMKDAGFTGTLINGGGLDSAATATGLAIVQ
jgi:rhodanese-related sulfurtransferase